MKPKHQRLILAILALAALIGAGLLAASALREEASYFYTPATLANADVEPGKAIRLGGMVQKGSVRRDADGITVHFIVQDRDATQAVSWRIACLQSMMKIMSRANSKTSTCPPPNIARIPSPNDC